MLRIVKDESHNPEIEIEQVHDYCCGEISEAGTTDLLSIFDALENTEEGQRILKNLLGIR